jgi:hypothetical protein
MIDQNVQNDSNQMSIEELEIWKYRFWKAYIMLNLIFTYLCNYIQSNTVITITVIANTRLKRTN